MPNAQLICGTLAPSNDLRERMLSVVFPKGAMIGAFFSLPNTAVVRL
jgi:hypothetical protein